MSASHPILPFQDNTSLALSWLLRQGENCLDMTEAVYRQEAALLRTHSDGVLLRHKLSGGYLLGAETADAGAALLSALPNASASLTIHLNPDSAPPSKRSFSGSWHLSELWYWPKPEPPVLPLSFEVWPLDEGDIPEARQYDPSIPLEALTQQIQRRRVYGACIRNTLAGTIGTDPTGAIAWLTVRPDLRGRNIGRTLLRWMLRRELRQGHVPYLLLPEEQTGMADFLQREGLLPAPGLLLCGELGRQEDVRLP